MFLKSLLFYVLMLSAFALMIFSIGCGADDPLPFSKEEISEHAKEKASIIAYEYYSTYNLFSLSTETLDSFFESDSIIGVQVKVSYEWHSTEWSSILRRSINRQFKGDRTHLITFEVIADTNQLDNTVRYLNAKPPFQVPRAFSN